MQVQDVFLAAIDIEDRGRRAKYLADACGGDSALLQKVQALLAAHERPGDFLDVPALQQLADEQTSHGKARAQQELQAEIDLSFLEPTTRVDSLGRLLHYEVLEVVGRGGCGVVFKAFDEKLHRVVAIKMMTPELAATSPARKRFLREARATAAVRHENVVTIYAVEEKPLPFLVMEFVDGQTLQDRINEVGPLDVAEVVSIGQQLAAGLAAAHAQGLIHRDIKPANVILDRAAGRPKITDFGLARSADDASLTQSGAICGTPLYMSPEQAQGLDVDHRSDLFSLGSVLYAISSGRPPFRAPTAVAVLKRVVEERPRPIRDILPEVPEWLITIIARLHAKRPEERYGSAMEVAEALRRGSLSLSRAAPVAPPTAPVLPQTKPSSVRRQSAWRWALAAGASVALASVVLSLSFRSPTAPETPTPVPAARAAAAPKSEPPAPAAAASMPTAPPPETAVPIAAAATAQLTADARHSVLRDGADAIIGHWLVLLRVKDGVNECNVEFLSTGVVTTALTARTRARIRRSNPEADRPLSMTGKWSRGNDGVYTMTLGGGRTWELWLTDENHLEGKYGADHPLSGVRQVRD